MNITYYNKVLFIITLSILLLFTLFLGVYLYFYSYYRSYPPINSDCPNNWDISYVNQENLYCIHPNYDTNNINLTMENIDLLSSNKNLKYKSNTIDICKMYPIHEFKKNGTEYDDVICEKQKWSQKCNISWDDVFHNKDACANSKLGYLDKY